MGKIGLYPSLLYPGPAGTLRAVSSPGYGGASATVFVLAGYPEGYTDPDGREALASEITKEQYDEKASQEIINSYPGWKRLGEYFRVPAFSKVLANSITMLVSHKSCNFSPFGLRNCCFLAEVIQKLGFLHKSIV
jgi:hypothetical protein